MDSIALQRNPFTDVSSSQGPGATTVRETGSGVDARSLSPLEDKKDPRVDPNKAASASELAKKPTGTDLRGLAPEDAAEGSQPQTASPDTMIKEDFERVFQTLFQLEGTTALNNILQSTGGGQYLFAGNQAEVMQALLKAVMSEDNNLAKTLLQKLDGSLDLNLYQSTMVDFGNKNADAVVLALKQALAQEGTGVLKDLLRQVYPELSSTNVQLSGPLKEQLEDIHQGLKDFAASLAANPPANEAEFAQKANTLARFAQQIEKVDSAAKEASRSTTVTSQESQAKPTALAASMLKAVAATLGQQVTQALSQAVMASPAYTELVQIKYNLFVPNLLNVNTQVHTIIANSGDCRKEAKKMKEKEQELFQMIKKTSSTIPEYRGLINLDDVLATITETKRLIQEYNDRKPC